MSTNTIPKEISSIFITGATGFLSSHFILSAIHKYDKIYALVRGKSQVEATSRLIKSLDKAAESIYLPPNPTLWENKIHIIHGDVTKEKLGLSPLDIEMLRQSNIFEFWNFAGSLKYEEKYRDEIFSTNINGTLNSLETSKLLDINNFLHVSTAFSAGQSTGEIPEELHAINSLFNNPYEESKCIAEHHVSEYCENHGINFCILRPGIVVGPSTTQKTGGSDTGLYGFISILNRTKEALKALDHAPTLIGDEYTPVHISPVDYFVQDALYIAEHGFQNRSIYHTLCTTSINADDLSQAFQQEIGIPKFHLTPSYDRDPTPIEAMYNKVLKMYGVACRYPKQFDRSLPAQQSISIDQLNNYIRECISSIKRKRISVNWTRNSFNSHDDTILTSHKLETHEKKNAKNVVLVNAFGMEADIWESLVNKLKSDFNIYTWDSRGIPNLNEDFDEDHCDLTSHARDLSKLLEFHEINQAHFIGWCTGAQVILRFSNLFPNTLLSFASVNGAFSFHSDITTTDFKQNIMHLMPKISQSREHANAYHRVMYGNKTETPSNSSAVDQEAEQDTQTVMNTVTSSAELITNMTTAPFRTSESLYRYAHLVQHLIREPEHIWAEGFTQPTFIISGDLDTVAHPDESKELALRIPNSQLKILEGEDHFSVHHSSKYQDEIVTFLKSTGAKQTRPLEEAIA